jgi:flagellar hook protein FlgE
MIKALDSAVGGIAAGMASFQRASARIARPADPTLERDLVQTMADSTGVTANAKVAQTADQMVGTLIDIVA